ncbi:MAG: hypothetical protein ABI680_08495, partial [Chthoniobacteraceae bacterium]
MGITRPLACLALTVVFLGRIDSRGWAQNANLPSGTRLIMSHFKAAPASGGDERLYISISSDGVNWTALNSGNPVWQPDGWAPFHNVVRDPSIIFENGFYWVAFTSGNYGRHASFGLLKSSDLLTWTKVGEIDTTISGAIDSLTWGPIFFRDGDGSVHILVAISRTGGAQYNPVPDMRVHELHPLDAGFTQWSAPVLLELPAANTNECWVWKRGAVYHAAYIDFATGGWYHTTSSNLISGWSPATALGFGSLEGGMMLPRPDGGYRFCLETGNGGSPIGYRYYDYDSALTSPAPAQSFNASMPMRNGKMIAAPATTQYADWQAEHLADLPIALQQPGADPDGDGF